MDTSEDYDTYTRVQKAASLIANAEYVTVLTGAGISTPSGVPDFRTVGSGLWTRYSPMEVASLTSFRQHPQRFFEWLRPLASHMYSAEPNPAHLALAEMETKGFLHTLITQNIDVLHHKAGSKNILEIHGTLNTLSCTSCYYQTSSDGYLDEYIDKGIIPICPKCGSILKPDVILFEEQLPVKVWLEARKASKQSDLMIVAGSSLIVMPVAGLPGLVIENGGRLIVINNTSTYIDEQADVVITDDVASALPAIANEVFNGYQ